MQRTRMRHRPRRTITPKPALRKQFELFMVRMTRDGTRGTYPSREGTGETEVYGLADVAEGVGAGGELVREG